jgi:hypothetical protein
VASNLAGEDELDFDVNIQGNIMLIQFSLSVNVMEKRVDLVYFRIIFFS